MKDFSHGKVSLIGAGPGDPDLLTVKALRLLQGADVVVFDRLVSPAILALIPETALRVDVGKASGNHPVVQEEINDLLIDLARDGLRVVRLKGGDPLIFGRGGEEAAELAAAGVAFEFVPGITAAQGAAASTGVPLTHRGLSSGVRYVTGHRAGGAKLDFDWASLADPETTLVVYMGAANIAEIAFELMRHKLAAQTPVMAVSSATTPDEQRIISTLGSIAADMATCAPAAPVLFIIGRVVSLHAVARRALAVRYA